MVYFSYLRGLGGTGAINPVNGRSVRNVLIIAVFFCKHVNINRDKSEELEIFAKSILPLPENQKSRLYLTFFVEMEDIEALALTMEKLIIYEGSNFDFLKRNAIKLRKPGDLIHIGIKNCGSLSYNCGICGLGKCANMLSL